MGQTDLIKDVRISIGAVSNDQACSCNSIPNIANDQVRGEEVVGAPNK
jgi:hypothetical protein